MGLPKPGASDPIEVILKLAGDACNLNCVYCYEKREVGPRNQILKLDSVARFLGSLDGRPINVGLHGGEPLVYGKKRTADLLEILRCYDPNMEIRIQTNGYLYDADWEAIFTESPLNIILGVSIDGRKEENSYRVDYKGNYSVDSIEKVIKHTKLPMGLICVVHKQNIVQPIKIFEYFSSFDKVKTVSFVPCFDYSSESREYKGISGKIIQLHNPDNTGKPGWAITPMEYLNFLESIWDCWEMSGKTLLVEPFVSVIRKISGNRPESCDFTPEKCAHVLTVYPDGTVNSCDELNKKISKLGEIGDAVTPMTAFKENNEIDRVAKSVLDKCTQCSHQNSCGGGCIATRQRYYNTPYYHEYCNYKKGLIDHVQKKLTEVELL